MCGEQRKIFQQLEVEHEDLLEVLARQVSRRPHPGNRGSGASADVSSAMAACAWVGGAGRAPERAGRAPDLRANARIASQPRWEEGQGSVCVYLHREGGFCVDV